MDNAVYSVSEFTQRVDRALSGCPELNNIGVCGEVSRITVQSKSAYMDWIFFSLREGEGREECSLKVAIFKSTSRLTYMPKEGDEVIVLGSVSISRKQSQYQIKGEDIIPYGEGAKAAALQMLTEKLRAEGLFNQHRPLPRFPKKIAVVTSPTGAVWHDICDKLAETFPAVTVVCVPAQVQGAAAVPSLVSAVRRAQTIGADVMIIARGGGSKEDLDCFNSEELARAIFASTIPTVSAVGHEVDHSLSDDVADVSASTPTSAAVIVTKAAAEEAARLDGVEQYFHSEIKRIIDSRERRLMLLGKDVQLNSPRNRILRWEQTIAQYSESIAQSVHRRLDNAESRLKIYAQSISDLNPLAVLSRGYSTATYNGKAVRSAKELSVGDVIDVRFDKGSVSAAVKSLYL
ncbi:MAG: exodeoxyribonuclease VII large subunit [Oscillospiraceae bacterium]|nr:exodeoxyribonuclease VII large subunit [Oscillospiraceae bacterium]